MITSDGIVFETREDALQQGLGTYHYFEDIREFREATPIYAQDYFDSSLHIPSIWSRIAITGLLDSRKLDFAKLNHAQITGWISPKNPVDVYFAKAQGVLIIDRGDYPGGGPVEEFEKLHAFLQNILEHCLESTVQFSLRSMHLRTIKKA
jgi:hypothetical protein